jgi:phosphorylcholine metabolism protein LicD
LEKYNKLSVKYSINIASYCCLADRFSNWYDLPTSMLYETQLFNTEIGMFRIPKEFDKILQIWYGNYMEIPSLGSRMEEFKRHYDFLTKNCPLGEKNDTE